MLVVGLTGGIATGKSTVSSLFAAQGVPIIDADVLAREVVRPGTRCLSRIVAEFGEEVLLPDGFLDRKKLGEVVFNDPAKRRKLNGIVHPAVRWRMVWDVLKCWALGRRVCILDVPLLIESEIYKWVGRVVVVYCPEDNQLQRLVRRDGITEEQAAARLNAQLSIELKREYADYIVDNSGSPEDSERSVEALAERLKRDAGRFWWLKWIVPPWGLAAALWTLFRRRKVYDGRKKRVQ